ncbi:coniferyl-alcohol dehydrogenase [Paraburkholderia sp. Ac-20347]|uniref:coniferyl-alcohol dehydrogenase n=1 Tax=Paraburkholderia sp. Ac-20347 TaxID=2703892 RepID=UPI00197FB7D1|nr:coniferyl-alcohol dehydrogenase [Paraburkholderia sp. Ac-20347]MBN3813891.1 SDR family oxidoreductase [Paraburkholderia sp. Ac-20347]
MLQGKTVIITGAASGVGAATAALAASQGAQIISIDINRPPEPIGEFFRADLSSQASIDELVNVLPAGADGLANIAGLPPTRPAEAVVAVNLVGLKYLTNRLVPKLANGASIVNIASLAGIGWPDEKEPIQASAELGFSDVAAFCKAYDIYGARSYFFSKEALIVWTMQNRWTWRERGIRMNAISPGPVETPILKDFLATLGARAEEDTRIMDRPGTPADIAPVVAFLLSDKSGWIRGTNIPVDGGMSSHVLCKTHGY